MHSRCWSTITLVATLVLVLAPTSGLAQITPYTQDFESLIQTDIFALGDEGWLVYGNVYSPDGSTYLYGYGAFPAPNDPLAPAFSAIALGEGGTEQGLQQLVVFSDYNNTDHGVGNLIESNVFREWPITAENLGQRWVFEFDAKLGDLVAPSTAGAFIKTIDPNNGFAATNFIRVDTDTIPVTWGTYSLSLDITDEALPGQIFQIGFICEASNYVPSGIVYDNINLYTVPLTDAPAGATVRNVSLGQNYPNPFNPTTQIEFALPVAGQIDLSVYDLAGRRVATLQRGHVEAGPQVVTWNGRTDEGVPVASGQYRYLLRTEQGNVSRAMTLLK